jgi:hypothetical protein
MKREKPKMITPREFAAKHGVAYTTVLFWLKNEMIEGVQKETLPFGKNKFVYGIPETAPKPELKPGPKKQPEVIYGTGKLAARRRPIKKRVQPSLFEPSAKTTAKAKKATKKGGAAK